MKELIQNIIIKYFPPERTQYWMEQGKKMGKTYGQKYMFNGVYEGFSKVPIMGGGFSGENWLHSLKGGIEKIKDFDSNLGDNENNCLSTLISLLAQSQEEIRVLDYGGGIGIEYYRVLKNTSIDKNRLEFQIVENYEICELGRSMVPEINFTTFLPVGNFDIIYLGSVLQYVEDWKGLLKELKDYKSEYILLSDVFAGNNQFFVSAQSYGNSKIPYQFLNLSEILNEMSGYELVLKVPYRLKFEKMMENYPEELRIKNTFSLLFRKTVI